MPNDWYEVKEIRRNKCFESSCSKDKNNNKKIPLRKKESLLKRVRGRDILLNIERSQLLKRKYALMLNNFNLSHDDDSFLSSSSIAFKLCVYIFLITVELIF